MRLRRSCVSQSGASSHLFSSCAKDVAEWRDKETCLLTCLFPTWRRDSVDICAAPPSSQHLGCRWPHMWSVSPCDHLSYVTIFLRPCVGISSAAYFRQKKRAFELQVRVCLFEFIESASDIFLKTCFKKYFKFLAASAPSQLRHCRPWWPPCDWQTPPAVFFFFLSVCLTQTRHLGVASRLCGSGPRRRRRCRRESEHRVRGRARPAE